MIRLPSWSETAVTEKIQRTIRIESPDLRRRNLVSA